MADRLTEKKNDKYVIDSFKTDFAVDLRKNCLHSLYGEPVNKLGRLEDILEEYGIESVEELDYLLEVFKKMRKQYGKLNQENCKSKKELDTWKRACELACEDLQFFDYGNEKTEDGIIMKVDYFYQQAKKECEQEEV